MEKGAARGETLMTVFVTFSFLLVVSPFLNFRVIHYSFAIVTGKNRGV